MSLILALALCKRCGLMNVNCGTLICQMPKTVRIRHVTFGAIHCENSFKTASFHAICRSVFLFCATCTSLFLMIITIIQNSVGPFIRAPFAVASWIVIIQHLCTCTCICQDGRLKSGDRILQIGGVDVRDMNTEGVAIVLRQSGAHVRLIVARGVDASSAASCASNSQSFVVGVSQMNEAFEQLAQQLPPPNDYISPLEVQSDGTESQMSTMQRDVSDVC